MDNNKVFIEDNQYGYRLNVNEPHVNELYRRYKAKHNLAPHIPLTDEQRLDFEQHILDMFERNKRKKGKTNANK